MANKTYFKGKKKSTVKSKKYQFAGFDEATQIDNTGYLNALYNPKYFDPTTVSNETIQKNIDQTINTSKQSSADYAADKEANKQSLLNLTTSREQVQKEEEASMRNMAEQTKQQYTAKNLGVITGLGTPAAKFGLDLAAKKAAEKTVQEVAKAGGNQILKTGANIKAAQTTGQAALSGTNLLYSGLGAAGVVGGEAWKYFSDDKNPYTYKPSEAAGTIGGNTLSWAGTGAGLGTAILPGLGTLIGAGVGALGGLTVGLVQNRKKKKMAASLESERAEQEADWNAQKAEYDKYLGQRQRVYDYNQRVARTGMTTLAEQSRQNRLMGLTEGQLAGNTNIAMTGGGRKYFGKGGVNVPGGQVVPIGQGAVEFVGRSHAQGGIRLDAKTEVEGGETMDKVRMKNGKMNDYFFSKFFKYKGKSFAQHHKELIKRGASQKEIQALAKKQEAMANRKGEKDRSPKQVAKYGGLRQYQTGNFKETADAVKESDGVYRVRDAQGNILAESSDKNVAEKRAQDAVIAAQSKKNSTNLDKLVEMDDGSYITRELYEKGFVKGYDPTNQRSKDFAAKETGEVAEAGKIVYNNGKRYILPGVKKFANQDTGYRRGFESSTSQDIHGNIFLQEQKAAGLTPGASTITNDKSKLLLEELNNMKGEGLDEKMSDGKTKRQHLEEKLKSGDPEQIKDVNYQMSLFGANDESFTNSTPQASANAASGYELPKGKQKVDKDFRFYENPGVRGKGTEEKKYTPMYTEQQLRNARILAGVGFGSQLIAPVASLFMKPKLVEAPKAVTPELMDTAAARVVGPMVGAGTIAAPRLGRVAPDTQDILDRDVANRQALFNIGDPSSMIAMIASTGKTNEAERKAIADAQRTNVELAGKEGMLKFEASKANVASSLEAQRANQAAINEAQGRYLNVLSKNQEMKNQAYLANLDAQTKTRLANAQLLADKQNRDIAAMSTFGTNVAGGVGDFLSYGIEGEKSRMASGDTGVYERNFIPIFGTNKSKTGGVKKKMYGGTNSYTSRLGDLKFKRALKVK